MNEDELRRSIADDEHLRLLSWGYVLSGIMTGLFSLLGLFYAAMGLIMSRFFAEVAKSPGQVEQIPPESVGTIIGIFGALFFLIAITLALAKLWAARCIKRRESRTFCQLVGAITCLGIPYGTVLGVCTFLLLGRPSVATKFDARRIPVPASPR